MEALNNFHGVKIADSSANIIQAQRDYFGAHTYERKDDSSGKKYHSDWTSEV
jgi:6-phosphogluconate dehydrogenase